ncbi:uncharacterized protein At4g04775-like [Vicia villosa]|uniref:uncharacterized protein At4g04775-like n=1 Tax=Vicia villosa TaxID=3911 RepID=UPI00273C1435|nr:uncharacterized protein At4g04775-like [Vicia villosa]
MSHYSEASSRTKSPSVHGECRCGLDAPLMTSWTDSNPGRRFYGCGMYKIQGYKRCNHFVWYDEEMDPRAKEMISTLNQKLKIANLKIDAGKIQEDEMSKKSQFAVVILLIIYETSCTNMTTTKGHNCGPLVG